MSSEEPQDYTERLRIAEQDVLTAQQLVLDAQQQVENLSEILTQLSEQIGQIANMHIDKSIKPIPPPPPPTSVDRAEGSGL